MDEAVGEQRPVAEAAGVQLVRLESEGAHVVRADSGLIRELLTNLVANAIEALAETPFPGGWAVLRAAKLDGPPDWPDGSRVPSRVVAALRRGLDPEVTKRWPSMGDLLAVLSDEITPRRRGWVPAAAVAGLVPIK